MSSELYLCVYAQEFPAQAMLRFRPELRQKPIVVMGGEVPFQQVCSLNRFARKLGVVPGMSRTEMDSFPSAIMLKRSTLEEHAAQLALLESVGCFSPRIEDITTSTAFSCVLDIAGSEKLFGPPQQIASRVREAIAALNIHSSIAVSCNFDTAVSLARGTISIDSSIVVPPGNERLALSNLPLSVLDISPEHSETFSQWGVTTLGILAMLPEKDLIARLGQEGKRLRLLARGESPHLFLPIDPVVALEERLELDTPVEILDSLLFGVSMMLDQLIARAKARILSLAVITAELGLDGGGLHIRVVRPALPTNDKQLMAEAASPGLDRPSSPGRGSFHVASSGDRHSRQSPVRAFLPAAARAQAGSISRWPASALLLAKNVLAASNSKTLRSRTPSA